MPSPYNDYPYLIIEDFLSMSACDEIVSFTVQHSEAEQARVKSLQQGIVQPAIDENIRKTCIHELPDRLLEIYHKNFIHFQSNIEDFFNIALTTATSVQALEYTEGAFYIKHADDSNELIDEQAETVGFIQVAPHRKITTLLFMTSHNDRPEGSSQFNGGELIFNYLFDDKGDQIKIRPKAGMMVVFPSNPLYSHEVLPVISGLRLSLVQWHNGIIV